jgi:hypothetical protein
MNAEQFLSALAPALVGRDAREKLLADPRSVLAAAGLALPDWITVVAVEGDAPELSITMPPMLDPNAELSEESLAFVSGGCDPPNGGEYQSGSSGLHRPNDYDY